MHVNWKFNIVNGKSGNAFAINRKKVDTEKSNLVPYLCLEALSITVFRFFGITRQESKPASKLWWRVLSPMYHLAFQTSFLRILN